MQNDSFKFKIPEFVFEEMNTPADQSDSDIDKEGHDAGELFEKIANDSNINDSVADDSVADDSVKNDNAADDSSNANNDDKKSSRKKTKSIDNYAIFQELNAIAEEIERCRGISF